MPIIPLAAISAIVGQQAIQDAIVQAGELSPTDERALYESEGGIYTDYMVRNFYEFDPTIFMMPITSPDGWIGQKAAFVCLSEPTLATWICDWTAERRVLPPEVPTSETGDPNCVLLYKYIDPDMLELMADGEAVVYRLSGTYIYGFKDSAKAKMYHGRPPWMSNAVKQNLGEKFSKGIARP